MDTPQGTRQATSQRLPAAALEGGPLRDRAGLRVVGEISLTTQPVWERLLEELVGGDEPVCHLELSAVSFIDVRGVASLAAAAEALGEGRRIVLWRPPASLRRTLELFWPELSTIEVAQS
ncbi:STAS domain-containing protein [Streptomyces sp. NPDC001848]|uniref:STAS domain-containing protein n=1 Tax=Streptomyces sp. NPDC001848 TaxID=3364618 RepID=UPI003692F47D